MMPEPSAPTRLTLDAEALAANWRTLDRLSGTAAAGAAIKADAYGTGARRAASVLREAGCRAFFVAHWSEAEEVRDLLAPGELSVLHGPLTADDVAFARASGVRPVLNSLEQVTRWVEAGGGPCDLMVDTGINRLGLPLEALSAPIVGQLTVEVLLSHLASAEAESPLNEVQRKRWDQARAVIPHNRASLANSAGIMRGPAYHGDLTRPGLALYGGVPCEALAGLIRQVARPEAAILQVRSLSAGDTVGYNETFTATAPMRVGVVALGYADGYLRCWSNQGHFRANGSALPVLGRVSMDMTVVDLTDCPDLAEGDWIAADYELPEAARRSGLSQYELLTLLGRRFAR